MKFIETNGIRMHYVEAGSGPLVILLHGFPESWNSWHHQLPALAAAGFHAVAPDLRGYGQTEAPKPLEAYDIFQLTGDVVGLVHALGEQQGDRRPRLGRLDRILRSAFPPGSPPRRPVNQTDWEQQTYPGKVFYQAALRNPGSNQFLMLDVKSSILRGLHSLSGEAEGPDRWLPVRDPAAPRGLPNEPKMPSWLSENDLNFLVKEYERAGFTGGLNYYRNMDRNWALTPFLDGAKILQPTLFVAGDRDPVIGFLRAEYDNLEANVPNLRNKVLLPGVGHWTQRENPSEVNRLLLEFLEALK